MPSYPGQNIRRDDLEKVETPREYADQVFSQIPFDDSAAETEEPEVKGTPL